MKHLFKPQSIKYAFLLFLLTFTQAIVWGEDISIAAGDTTTPYYTWHTEQWVWVVGGVAAILLIVAFTMGNGSSRRYKATVLR